MVRRVEVALTTASGERSCLSLLDTGASRSAFQVSVPSDLGISDQLGAVSALNTMGQEGQTAECRTAALTGRKERAASA